MIIKGRFNERKKKPMRVRADGRNAISCPVESLFPVPEWEELSSRTVTKKANIIHFFFVFALNRR